MLITEKCDYIDIEYRVLCLSWIFDVSVFFLAVFVPRCINMLSLFLFQYQCKFCSWALLLNAIIIIILVVFVYGNNKHEKFLGEKNDTTTNKPTHSAGEKKQQQCTYLWKGGM